MAKYKEYEISIKSVSGFYEQYSGNVTVYARDEEEAEELAFRKLKSGAFPDRSRSMWRVTEIKCVRVCPD